MSASAREVARQAFRAQQLLAALWFLSSCGAPGPSVAFGQKQSGEGTFYSATGAGACSFDASPGDMNVAAMNAPQFDNSGVCGACAKVKGPKGEVTVRIVDLCPECKSGDLDFSHEAFVQIADEVQGRVAIEWQFVSCSVSGPVQYLYKDGSSQWWTAIQVRNHRLPVEKLELFKGDVWIKVNRENYNYFVQTDGAGTGEIKVRITATDGQILEDTLPGVESGRLVSGKAQFR